MEAEAKPETAAYEEALKARNEALSYHTFCQSAVAEARLRAVEGAQALLERQLRSAPGRPLRALFLVAHTSLFDVFLPIYRAMLEDPAFEPSVIAFKRVDVDADITVNEVRAFFDALNIPAHLNGWEEEEPYYPLLSSSDYDLVFYTLGSGAYPDAYKLENVATRFLTVYLSYGFLLANMEDYQFGQPFHQNAWRLYASTERELRLYKEKSRRLDREVVNVGYPKFDLYRHVGNERTEKPLVIWSPHWTIGSIYPTLNFGCFHILCNDMLSVFSHFEDQVDFLFKPHPNLRYALNSTGFMPFESFEIYLDMLRARPNVSVWTQGNNIELFAKSAGMITDSISFLAEYLPSERPMAFTERPDRAELTTVGEALIDLYTTVTSAPEIIHFIQNEILDGKDERKNERKSAVSELLNVQAKESSRQILADLKERLRR